MHTRSHFALALLLFLLFWQCAGSSARAGGGPENVFLVVNSRSWASQTISNHWSNWRKIPQGNVYYLDWDSNPWETDIETFRQRILGPILQTISDRRLSNQIDYIIYADDFPYRIDFGAEAANPQDRYASGSLTGFTYLAGPVMARDMAYENLVTNFYYRSSLEEGVAAGTHGFRTAYAWTPSGEIATEQGAGARYFISTELAYTSGRGNSVEQALAYLERSALVDGLQPEGTFYFMSNEDIRSRIRLSQFAPVIDQLRQMGHAAEILEGVEPQNKDDVMGAVLGWHRIKWHRCGSQIMPGAICENFTSFGGVMRYSGGQSPLTHILEHGAAGSSGTVIEPFASTTKFPHSGIQLHYARGSTLGEAFYQSVAGPYQLLIVGDPLCRPWANIPVVEVTGVEPGETVRGVVNVQVSATCGEIGVQEIRLFYDGQLRAAFPPGETLELDTTTMLDGYHELRFVAIEDSPIESQGRLIVPLTVDNHGGGVECSVSPGGKISWSTPLIVTASATGANSIGIMHQGRTVGTIEGESGTVILDPQILGLGPVSLQAVAYGPGGLATLGFAAPIQLEIAPPPALPARPELATIATTPGVRVALSDGSRQVATSTEEGNWLASAGVAIDRPFQITAAFEVNAESVYQFQSQFKGQLSIAVDGKPLFEETSDRESFAYVPVSLAPGWHELTLTATLEDLPSFRIDFGGPGAYPLSKAGFKCQP